MQATKNWNNIFKVLKEKNKNMLTAKLLFRFGDTKSFPPRQKLKKFMTYRLILQEMLKRLV